MPGIDPGSNVVKQTLFPTILLLWPLKLVSDIVTSEEDYEDLTLKNKQINK